jgi:hypothetical protein
LLAAAMKSGIGFWDLETGSEAGYLPLVAPFFAEFGDAGELIVGEQTGCYRWPVQADRTAAGLIRIGPPEPMSLPPGGKFARKDGEWDTEYNHICNAVLPFNRCAAHIGDEGWGREGVSYADLQVRVFDLAEPPEDIERRIDGDGATEVERITGKRPAPEHDTKTEWVAIRLAYGRFYIDYGATAHVDFRLRHLGKRTIVFMYTDYTSQQKTIDNMLHSVTPPPNLSRTARYGGFEAASGRA